MCDEVDFNISVLIRLSTGSGTRYFLFGESSTLILFVCLMFWISWLNKLYCLLLMMVMSFLLFLMSVDVDIEGFLWEFRSLSVTRVINLTRRVELIFVCWVFMSVWMYVWVKISVENVFVLLMYCIYVECVK